MDFPKCADGPCEAPRGARRHTQTLAHKHFIEKCTNDQKYIHTFPYTWRESSKKKRAACDSRWVIGGWSKWYFFVFVGVRIFQETRQNVCCLHLPKGIAVACQTLPLPNITKLRTLVESHERYSVENF